MGWSCTSQEITLKTWLQHQFTALNHHTAIWLHWQSSRCVPLKCGRSTVPQVCWGWRTPGTLSPHPDPTASCPGCEDPEQRSAHPGCWWLQETCGQSTKTSSVWALTYCSFPCWQRLHLFHSLLLCTCEGDGASQRAAFFFFNTTKKRLHWCCPLTLIFPVGVSV